MGGRGCAGVVRGHVWTGSDVMCAGMRWGVCGAADGGVLVRGSVWVGVKNVFII